MNILGLEYPESKTVRVGAQKITVDGKLFSEKKSPFRGGNDKMKVMDNR